MNTKALLLIIITTTTFFPEEEGPNKPSWSTYYLDYVQRIRKTKKCAAYCEPQSLLLGAEPMCMEFY